MSPSTTASNAATSAALSSPTVASLKQEESNLRAQLEAVADRLKVAAQVEAAAERAKAEAEAAKQRDLILTLPGYVGVADLLAVRRQIDSVLIRQGQAAKRGKRAAKSVPSIKARRRGKTEAYAPELKERWAEAFRAGSTVSEVSEHLGGASAACIAKTKRKLKLVGKTFPRDEVRLKELFEQAA